MDPKLWKSLDKVLDDVVEVLRESGWHDEAAWYEDLRGAIVVAEPGSPQLTELLVELEQSFLGLGSFMDIPLDADEAMSAFSSVDTHHQRLGLVTCASGIIHQMKKSGSL